MCGEEMKLVARALWRPAVVFLIYIYAEIKN